jgi:hypothetical protein
VFALEVEGDATPYGQPAVDEGVEVAMGQENELAGLIGEQDMPTEEPLKCEGQNLVAGGGYTVFF